ncbi:MAG TPA: ionic transporter y4hA [Candidatus Polarisedimenticolia bacterium]|nr:ionic transporter y4hA [Candidatus Polarisedimenticolia bacterium]
MPNLRRFNFAVPPWSVLVPAAAFALLVAIWGRPPGLVLLPFIAAGLVGAVLVAVHHAEVIALRVGEPFGTLVLALAVTVIEVSLIVALMFSGGPAASALARDTVYATVMIICNGVVGLCLLLGALRHRTLAFRVEGTTPALAVLATLATLTLVLPTFTSTTPGPTLSPAQLVFVGVVSLALYAVFVFVQTVRHREYFLPPDGEGDDDHLTPPTGVVTLISLALLFLSLVTVVGLAKTLAPSIEGVIVTAAVPHAVVGIAIALIVLLPETWAAARAALRNRMQTSFNLALGSALATIGLTIPAVAATAMALNLSLQLGLPTKEIALLSLTLLISSMTMSRGRATVLQGAVHLVLFVVFLFLAVVP